MDILIKTVEEMQNYLTFNKSIAFERIRPHVVRSQRAKMIPLIGNSLYNELNTAYKNADYKVEVMEEKYHEPMSYIQDALSNIGFLCYIAQLQLVIGENGIRIAVNENNKTAFQWQIEDFKYQLGLDGYNAFDSLLSYLEINKVDFPNWTSSDAFFVQKQYLVDTSVKFNHHYYINDSRITYLSVRYIMNRIENHVVKPLLGTKLFNKLKSNFVESNLSDKEKTLIEDYLEPGITLLTVAKGVIERALNVLDSGVSVNLYSYYANLKIYDKKLRSLDDKGSMVLQLETDGNAFLQAGRNYVEKNIEDFPDFEQSDLPESLFQILNNENRKFFGA